VQRDAGKAGKKCRRYTSLLSPFFLQCVLRLKLPERPGSVEGASCQLRRRCERPHDLLFSISDLITDIGDPAEVRLPSTLSLTSMQLTRPSPTNTTKRIMAVHV
jgi:hypothetical protein